MRQHKRIVKDLFIPTSLSKNSRRFQHLNAIEKRLRDNLDKAGMISLCSGRNKVALAPGHSLMDWIRLTHKEDLAGTGGKLLRVTAEELENHCTPDDAWICIKGKRFTDLQRILMVFPQYKL